MPSTEYYVQIRFLGEWCVMTECADLAQAQAVLAYWRNRSCWKFRIKRA